MEKENENFGEQPLGAEVHAVATGVDEGTEMHDGSPLGKFKDSAKLLDAYNELQSEFTRKCQRLSEAEKKLQEFALGESASKSQDEVTENEFAWNKNISEFLQSHKNANLLVEEITEEMMKNVDLKNSPDGLEKAYAKVIENKYIPHEELVKNQEFLNKYVYSNDEIKNKIINEYVSSLQKSQNPISINNSGYNGGVATANNFNSLEEAGKYVEKMFKF